MESGRSVFVVGDVMSAILVPGVYSGGFPMVAFRDAVGFGSALYNINCIRSAFIVYTRFANTKRRKEKKLSILTKR